MNRTKIVWRWLSFNKLGGAEVHEMIALRESVFVVEQNCAYQEE
ncbi:MAG TPA: drug:proton antiporter, partial [Gammaproteobacteria bacterium]|nr:drug:proton antiporter [Gammaproteobacteria bacterium]